MQRDRELKKKSIRLPSDSGNYILFDLEKHRPLRMASRILSEKA